MQYFEVASITDVRETSDRVLIFKLKNNQTKTIQMWSPYMEPLSYPLLFNYGERGWGKGDDCIKVEFTDYLASRLLRPEDGLWLPSQADPSKLINVNRFQALRLGMWKKQHAFESFCFWKIIFFLTDHLYDFIFEKAKPTVWI
jgi:hypothetical protein